MCNCTCRHVGIYVSCMYTGIHERQHICIWLCVYVSARTQLNPHECTNACIQLYIRMHACMYECIYVSRCNASKLKDISAFSLYKPENKVNATTNIASKKNKWDKRGGQEALGEL